MRPTALTLQGACAPNPMASGTALITRVSGQDGAPLAELLLSKSYVVRGARRRSSSFTPGRVDHLDHDLHEKDVRFFTYYGDMTGATNVIRIVQESQPAQN